MKILVTGAAGFIGARFVESCAARGLALVSVDDREHFGAREEHRGIAFGEIVDREDLFEWLGKHGSEIDAVLHLGACSRTTELDEAFLERNNVEYSKKLWRFACERKIPFVYASSAATYGGGELGYEDEDALTARLKPLNPYGESKRRFDAWVLEEEKRGSHPPAWSGFKFFNVYGPGERHKGSMASVILHAFDQIERTGRMKLFRSHRKGIADGEQKRDFIDVGDVIEVLHFALGTSAGASAGKPIARGIYNLGTGQARSFLDLVRATFRAMGRPEAIDFIDTPVEIRERYQYFTEARMERLRAQGYTRPFTSLEDGVERYVKWLKARR